MNDSPLVDVPAAAAYLAVSVSTVRRLVGRGELAARRVGRQLRFEPDALRAFTTGAGPVRQPVRFASAIARLRYEAV